MASPTVATNARIVAAFRFNNAASDSGNEDAFVVGLTLL
jgi:hypothetical protein